MPQLDIITWFPQVCWLIIGFLSLYSLILKNFSPAVFKSRKIRQNKINLHSDSIVFFSYINAEVLYHRWSYFKKFF
jgi:hypothetical protein